METDSADDSILANAAALHSLKKEQLIKLCKTYGVKTGGKKSELADRLAALSTAPVVTKENVDPIVGREIIQLGSIKEESSSDFGSFKSSMSLKSLVSSFGFARSTSQSTSFSSLPPSQPEDQPVSPIEETEPQPHEIPLPPSPLIEPFTPPPNVEVGNTIRLVNIPRFSTASPGTSTFTFDQPTTPVQNTSNTSNWRAGDTPMLPAFRTSFDLVVEGGVGTPARDIARLLKGADFGTPTKAPADGRFEFGTPRASGWAFRPSLSLPPPVPPLPEMYRTEKSDEEMKMASEGEDVESQDAPKQKIVPRPSVTQSVMEELMRRAELPVDPSRPVKPIPRRSLAANGSPTPLASSSSSQQTKTDRFDKAHAQMEARMAAINEPKGLLKKRKVEEDDQDVVKKSARVGGRASGARPRVSVGGRPRQSGVNGRPRTSGVRPRQSGVRPRVSGVRPPPAVAKKGLFGFVKGLFGGKKPEPTKKPDVKEKEKEKVEVKAQKSEEKKVEAPRKPSLVKPGPVARKITPTGSMGPPPPKFAPKRGSTTATGVGSMGARPSATPQGSVNKGSVSRASVASTSTARGSLAAPAKEASSSLRRPAPTPKGSVTSTMRGTTSGSMSSTTRGSINSTTRGSVTSTTRGSVRGSLAPPSSSSSVNTKGSLGRASVATSKPSALPRKVTPTGSTSSRLLQPTKSSMARASTSTVPETPKEASTSALATEAPSTPLPSPPRIFRTPLSEATFVTSPSKIPVRDAGNSSIVSRSASSRRPRISRTTVVARLAARREVPSTPQNQQASSSSSGSGSGSGSGSSLAPGGMLQAPNTVGGGGGERAVRKSAVVAGRRSVVVDRKVRSSVGGGGGKGAILGRRSVGAGPVRKR